MGNEKYINYYIETLTSTLTDCVVRNVSLQANARVSDDVIGELSKKVEELSALCASRGSEIESLKVGNINVESLKREYESLKGQQKTSETYRNELVKEREAHEKTRVSMQEQIDNLVQQIELLKTPPKKKNTKLEKQQPVSTDAVKDGGSF